MMEMWSSALNESFAYMDQLIIGTTNEGREALSHRTLGFSR
jgi:hypothetical protein